ncbi:MAG: DUF4112 domain-containing protein [Betaproteobacteria bacterium HGW-Betaproteobacteria-7]|jgi:hypothetical protein|nr:MAG: DUF4112 domain-containing protein [Betaproteobacteria bacterium HGW-Betaproteobacteria-7]
MEHRRPDRIDPKYGAKSQATLEQLKSLAWLLDNSIRLPGGFRIGVEALLGLIPVVGDTLGVLLSSYIVTQAAKLGVPRRVLLRMILNIAIEGVVGLVPGLGDIFDAAWKANQRNVNLLLRQVEQPGETRRASGWFVGLAMLLLIVLTVLLLIGSVLFINWAWDASVGPV